jgi:hypothetical protein
VWRRRRGTERGDRPDRRVQGRGNDVRSFTLESGGKEYRIRVAPDVDYGFQLSHLRTHQASLYPVRCTFERRAGRLYALEIVDA